MRAENEINADEYAELKKDMNADFARLDEQEKNLTEQDKLTTDFSANLERIEKALQGLCDGSDKKLTQDYMGRLIESVVPECNSRFIWNIRTGADKIVPLHANIGGRKNKAIVSVDEFTEEGEMPSVHKKSRIFDKLHRLLSHRTKRDLQLPLFRYTFPFEEAKAFRKAQGLYLRQTQWQDLTMTVWANV